MSRFYTLPPTTVITTDHGISSELLVIFNRSKILYHMKQYPDQKPSNFDFKKVIAEHVIQKDKEGINVVKKNDTKPSKNRSNGDKPANTVKKLNFNYVIVTKDTNFYAERGGQVSDTGNILLLDENVQVLDCQWYENVILHFVHFGGNEKAFNEKIKKVYLEEQRLMKIIKTNLQNENTTAAQEQKEMECSTKDLENNKSKEINHNVLPKDDLSEKETPQVKKQETLNRENIVLLEQDFSQNVNISDHACQIPGNQPIDRIEKNGKEPVSIAGIGDENDKQQSLTLEQEVERNKIICTMHPDILRRDRIRVNHTATHLLNHQISLLGGSQKGSLVEANRLRFDYSVPTCPSGKIKPDGSPSTDINHLLIELAIRHAIRLKRKVSIEVLTKEEIKQHMETKWKDTVVMQRDCLDKYPKSIRIVHTPTVLPALKTDTETINRLKKELEESIQELGNSDDTTSISEMLSETPLTQFTIDSVRPRSNGTKKKEPVLTEYEKQQESKCLWLFFPKDHRELCGGLHVRNTNEIKDFLILSDSTISSGIKRITAITGEVAAKMRFVDDMRNRELEGHLDRLNDMLSSGDGEQRPAHLKKPLTNEQIRKMIFFFKGFMPPTEPQSLIIREEFLYLRMQIFKHEARLKKNILKSYEPETWKKGKGSAFPYNLFLENTIVETLYAERLYGDKKTVTKDLNTIFIQKKNKSEHSLICFATSEGKCIFVGTEDILGHRSVGGRVTGELDITEDLENFLEKNSNIQ